MDEIEGDVFENGEVMGCVPGTGAHLVVGEGDIHAPVQRVLDTPVRPDGSHQATGIGRQATDVITLLDPMALP